MRGEICQLLSEDPDLAIDLEAGRRAVAEERLLARVVRLGPGDAAPLGRGELLMRPPASRGAGFLVLDGLMLRRVGISGRYGAELLGSGDLLRPWQGEDDEPTLSPEAAWRILEECRLAVLDREFLTRVAPFPEVTGRLIERALRRSRHLAILMSIVNQRRLDVRLQMLLWQLGGRWGRVGREGVRLPLRLRHTTLAELVAARRPSVTAALGRLTEQGLIRDDGGSWLLMGDPPEELARMGGIVESAANPEAARST